MSLARFVRQETVRVEKTIRRADTYLDQARCPLCRHPLIARVGLQGPYFHCGCVATSAAVGRSPTVPHGPTEGIKQTPASVAPSQPIEAQVISKAMETCGRAA